MAGASPRLLLVEDDRIIRITVPGSFWRRLLELIDADGSPEALRSKFLLLVARLFGESAAKRLEPGLKVRM